MRTFMNRGNLFSSFLIAVILIVISGIYPNTIEAFELKESSLFDNTEKDNSSVDYDYVDTDTDKSTELVDQTQNTNAVDHSHNNLDQLSQRTQEQQQQYRNLTEPARNHGENDGATNPSEIQKAVCTITAGEVKASAEAITTKTLKGVCGSAELQLAVNNLEKKIFNELAIIKSLILEKISNTQQQHDPLNGDRDCDCKCAHNSKGSFHNSIVEQTQQTEQTGKTTNPPPKSIVASEKRISTHPNNVATEYNQSYTIAPKLKSLQYQHPDVRPKAHSPTTSPRDKEVSKFNNTMLADEDIKIFTYYWRLEHFKARIENGQSISVESPRFAIKGKPLHLKAYFQHLHRDFLFLHLEYASLNPSATPVAAKGNTANSMRTNIMLDMGLRGGGNIFKAISNNDRILFKYKISILDQLQQNHRFPKDLVSQEFHNLETGFLVPNSALLGSTFIKDDTLLIQLFLYL